MARESALELPSVAESTVLADWAEATMRIEENQRISRAWLRSRLGSLLSGDEAELDLLLQEVANRSDLAPELYPFRRTSAGMEINTSIDGTCYDYLLLCSLWEAPFRQARSFPKVEQALDILAQCALAAYLGGNATAVRFAWPSDQRRPNRFADAVKWLADLLNLEVGVGRKSSHKKDGGVDVVAWRAFRDSRSAYTVVLAQTTIQKAWKTKARDVVVPQWSDWISFGAAPEVALVIPACVPLGDDYWDDARYSANIIIDRMRILELLESVDLNKLNALDGDPLLARMAAWNSEQFAGLVAWHH